MDINSIITNNIGAVTVTAIFIWYLVKRDKSAELRDSKFNEVIKQFSVKLQKLADSQTNMAGAIRSLTEKVDGK